jgi:hypothetical protein
MARPLARRPGHFFVALVLLRYRREFGVFDRGALVT